MQEVKYIHIGFRVGLWHSSPWTSEMQTPWIWHKWKKKKKKKNKKKKKKKKTLIWTDSFLCNRKQRVVVNGAKSQWAPVFSGVPHATVLGPRLFSLYINDIMVGIESEIRLFADDCICYRQIDNTEDTSKLKKGYWSTGQMGQEMGYDISAREM